MGQADNTDSQLGEAVPFTGVSMQPYHSTVSMLKQLPSRTGILYRLTAEQCQRFVASSRSMLTTLDITGGVPELESHYR